MLASGTHPTRPPAPDALLVKLSARPDFTAIEQMPRGPERKAAAYAAIVETSTESQKPWIQLAEQLRSSGAIAGYETLVSPNMLVVTPTPGKSQAALDAFAGAAGVQGIYSNDTGLRMRGNTLAAPAAPGARPGGLDVVEEPVELVAPPLGRPYGVNMVGAPAAWEQGADGMGLVFGSIDTGVDTTHEALAANYRGTMADGSVSHDYNWFDPEGSKVPKDYASHGTHTIGTAVGTTTGVAPKAKFISANGLTPTVDGTLRALQWMLAPTKVDGSAPDPTKAPDVVGMSWWTGSSSEDLFQESIRDLRAAGIEPVKSAGNNGPGPRTISSPGQFKELLATAAVDNNGNVARFSSRGPAPFPAGGITSKPDFAAPGVDTVSSVPGNRYGKMSGTSMAQPHMSGAVLDILSRFPQLTHDQLVAVLKAGVVDKGDPGFDPAYGHGIVNLPASLAAAERLLAG